MKSRVYITYPTSRAHPVSLGFLVLIMVLCPVFSSAQGLTEAEQLPIFLKVLTYNRTFRDNPTTSLKLGILIRPDSPASEAVGKDLRDALDALSDDQWHGLALTCEPVRWTSGEELARKLTESQIDILYVTPGQESLIPEISRWTRSLDILTLAPGHPEVEEGLSIGLAYQIDRPRIAVNLKALQEEGHELDSRILRLCKVVRE
jgi:hypothetical protein